MVVPADDRASDVVAIVRSAHERTEEFCVRIAKLQVPDDRVVVIHERPFTAALARAFEIGMDFDLGWTLCLDADVLLADGAVRHMLDAVQADPETGFGGTGYILDKFYGGRNRGGPHLYRTSLLRKALPLVPDAAESLRPETHVKMVMSAQGHDWGTIDSLLGVHDFEQFYRDIYRKMIVRARKSSQNLMRLLRRAMANSRIDKDFAVAAWGLHVGAGRSNPLILDAAGWTSEAETLLLASEMREKDGLLSVRSLTLVDDLLDEHFALQGKCRGDVGLGSFKRERIGGSDMSDLSTVAWRAGWCLTRAGLRVQRWASR